eukprot:TRINITY_DN10178_c0_g1_i1.p1 TRINITY_DN10178_c0_g1~~TRINITY_DN10178_c0_g1_i1.p1  ORF type:complete len:377 (-),score=59.54 TRINITY_DN10178_c0_g1_i1:139-1269(-)
MQTSFLLWVSILGAVLAHASTLISPTHPGWYFTEYNWYVSSAYAQSNNPGAYFKVGFSGTSAALKLDFKDTPQTPYMKLRYSVDDAPYIDVELPTTTNPLPLASGLSAASNHSLLLYVLASMQSEDRWNEPSCVVRFTNLVLDDKATIFPITLRPRRLLVFWDSIGEGVRVKSKSGSHYETDLTDNDSTMTWSNSLAAGLHAEVSVVAFGRQGYEITGNGNVPPLITPNDDTQTAFNKLDSKHARSFTVQPDFIFSGHGTNDNGGGAKTTKHALAWLIAQRQVTPRSHIFFSIPFGGFERASLLNAFAQYQQQYPADSLTHLLDLGSEAAEGLDKWTTAGTRESIDGVHPRFFRSLALGSLLAAEAVKILASSKSK